MNESWIIEWADTAIECEYLYNMYCTILEPDFFTETSDPARAALWLARDTFLEAILDLCRDLLWHNMENRPIGRYQLLQEEEDG